MNDVLFWNVFTIPLIIVKIQFWDSYMTTVSNVFSKKIPCVGAKHQTNSTKDIVKWQTSFAVWMDDSNELRQATYRRPGQMNDIGPTQTSL